MENVETIKAELDDALRDCENAPGYLIVQTVLYVLDKAEKEGRLSYKERQEACNYLSARYGYNF